MTTSEAEHWKYQCAWQAGGALGWRKMYNEVEGMTVNSRAKGIRGELECRNLLRKYGFEARRGQQYAGGGESPDVIHSIPGLHIEVKRTETLSIYKAMAQAISDAGGNTPTVFHKRNNKEWLVVLHARDFLELIKELHRGTKLD